MYRFLGISIQRMEDFAKTAVTGLAILATLYQHLDVHAEGDNDVPSIALHGAEYIEDPCSSARERGSEGLLCDSEAAGFAVSFDR